MGYTTVRVNVGALIIDGIDDDDVYDDVPVSGKLLLEPMIDPGRPVQVADGGRMKIKAIAPFPVDIGLNGEISHRNRDYVTVPAPTAATSNVAQLQWKATFLDLKYGIAPVAVPPIYFWAEPGLQIDLGDHINIAPNPTAVQLSRGARGFGVVGAVPVEDEPVASFAIEYETASGTALSDPIPLPEGSGGISESEADTRYAPSRVKLKSLWSPYSSEIYDPADVESVTWESGVGSLGSFFPNGNVGVVWNNPRLNTQSQKLVPQNPAEPSQGARNHPTARTYGGAVLDISFELNDDRFAVMSALFKNMDAMLYVSDETGRMRRLKPRPIVFTPDDNGFGFLYCKFRSRRSRQVRYVGSFTTFYQILHSSNGILRKTPDLPMSLVIGDSYREAIGMKNANGSGVQSAESYHTLAISDYGQMRTGWAQARLALGGTGYFQNGTGAASNDPGPDGSVPFFSDANVAKIKAYGKNAIRLIEVNGTINDGALSGGKAGMKARALEGINKIYSWDRGIRFVLWGPEPLAMDTDNPAANVGTVHDLNRQALMEVAAEHPAVIGFIDAGNPANPFWSGIGSEAEPNFYSSQAALIGMDGIHPNHAGCQHYAHLGYDIMGEFYIEREREIVQ
ncbi:hypothetical protein CH298_02565 [Rhodococcoides fascians]|nr:hypothetical protein CH303_02565 [Rhodococcus fascians]OZF23068.1 hypothetical protein CH298_02565 [Rhodococcus fascians]OZF24782.1 hypothetical protein CH297_02565 [Rhodococcus fascians]OZF72377.1 hypothetical protein CH308_02570 [Rhodococcus fascians]OZF73675.1 hypothetical protein CH307_02565 [Rhodococcus fascians]